MPSPFSSPDAERLTRKEQQLLALLEQHPGRCFSRGYLLRGIWGYSDAARTRTVDVHVSRLRKKLQRRADVAIHTVVGLGYVLEQRLPRQPAHPAPPDEQLEVSSFHPEPIPASGR